MWEDVLEERAALKKLNCHAGGRAGGGAGGAEEAERGGGAPSPRGAGNGCTGPGAPPRGGHHGGGLPPQPGAVTVQSQYLSLIHI
eukprot:8361284-Pyramimonas_sp.AAC.1